MRPISIGGILFAALLSAEAVAGMAPVRCSLMANWSFRGKNSVYFLGKALADTIKAGPGATPIEGSGEGHSGPAGAGAFRGQVISVERLEPNAPAELTEALRASGGKILLVAWDYDAACQRIPWTAPAAWVTPGRRGLYHGTLRPAVYWAAGLPTLDVFATQFVPFPPPWMYRSGLDTTRKVTADELFEFVTTVAEIADEPGALTRLYPRLRKWADDHPDLAAIPTFADELTMHRFGYLREQASFHKIVSPLAGTWRIEMILAGSETFQFFARNATTPIVAEYDSARAFFLPEDIATRPPFQYELYSRFAPEAGTLDSLKSGPSTEGYFEVVMLPLVQSPDSTVWRGSLPFLRVARMLYAPHPSAVFMEYMKAQRNGDTTVFRRLEGQGVTERWRRLYTADSIWMADRFSSRDGARYQARYVLGKDGVIRAEEELRSKGNLLLTIRAERISTKPYPGNRPPQ